MKPEDLVIGASYKLKEQQLIYGGYKKDPYFNNDWYIFTLMEATELPKPLGILTGITLWNDEIKALKEADEKTKTTN